MKPEARRAKQQLQEYITRWKCIVPPGVSVRHVFIDSDAGEGEESTLANTVPHWEYHRATIKWYLTCVAGTDAKQVEEAVVHELAHVLCAGMESLFRGSNGGNPKEHAIAEHTVETVTQALLRTRKA